MFAAIGVFGTDTCWPDVIVAAITHRACQRRRRKIFANSPLS
jgi:hypothetical protein